MIVGPDKPPSVRAERQGVGERTQPRADRPAAVGRELTKVFEEITRGTLGAAHLCAAGAVRGFRAVYLGLFFNCIIMASVNLAACKIAGVLFGYNTNGFAHHRLEDAIAILAEIGYRSVAVTVERPSRPGDLDGDGQVTLLDLKIMREALGACRGPYTRHRHTYRDWRYRRHRDAIAAAQAAPRPSRRAADG